MVDKNKIQEMQILEQNLQNLFLQKQAFQMELSETESALKEIENAKDEVFKIIGQLMIKTEKSKMIDELSNKKKLLELRMKTFEKQEKALIEKIEDTRSALLDTSEEKRK
jgi:prefoldin beta subunit